MKKERCYGFLGRDLPHTSLVFVSVGFKQLPVLHLSFCEPHFEVLVSIPALCKRLWRGLSQP